jgi:hypothetical protein
MRQASLKTEDLHYRGDGALVVVLMHGTDFRMSRTGPVGSHKEGHQDAKNY